LLALSFVFALDINTASEKEFMSLKGIGVKTLEKNKDNLSECK